MEGRKSDERCLVQTLVKARLPGKITRFEPKSPESPWVATAMDEQIRLWRYCAGVAQFYREAARFVVGELGGRGAAPAAGPVAFR